MKKKKSDKNLENIEFLYKAILKLETVDECKKFFRDLCTITELEAINERFMVMKMINEGIPYREIADKTGVSSATITRVAHWLNNGCGGYKLILKKLGLLKKEKE
jgi:TrpR-related protein YerC/YecD